MKKIKFYNKDLDANILGEWKNDQAGFERMILLLKVKK